MNKFNIQSGATEKRLNPRTGQIEPMRITHTLDLSPWDEHGRKRNPGDYFATAKRIAKDCTVFPKAE